MYAFLIIIHVIVSLVLVFVILLQSGRGGGLSEAFGFGSTSTLFGASAQTFLQRATSICAIVFLITSVSLAILSSHQSKSLMDLNRIRAVLPPAEKETVPQEAGVPAVPAEPAVTETPAAEAEKVTAAEGQAVPVAAEAPQQETPKPE